MDYGKLKQEYARLLYDKQILETLKTKSSDSETERCLDALSESNNRALVMLLEGGRNSFPSPVEDVEEVLSRQCSSWCDVLLTYPEFLRKKEEEFLKILEDALQNVGAGRCVRIMIPVLLSETMMNFIVASNVMQVEKDRQMFGRVLHFATDEQKKVLQELFAKFQA